MKLSEHFTLEEATFSQTAVRNGLSNTPDELVAANMRKAAEHMELLRETLGNVPIRVSSWYRSPQVDQLVGGTGRTNGHSSGWCIDFTADGHTPLEVCQEVIEAGIKFDQLIYEGTWVHISFHPAMRQMVLTALFNPGKPTAYRNGLPE